MFFLLSFNDLLWQNIPTYAKIILIANTMLKPIHKVDFLIAMYIVSGNTRIAVKHLLLSIPALLNSVEPSVIHHPSFPSLDGHASLHNILANTWFFKFICPLPLPSICVCLSNSWKVRNWVPKTNTLWQSNITEEHWLAFFSCSQNAEWTTLSLPSPLGQCHFWRM